MMQAVSSAVSDANLQCVRGTESGKNIYHQCVPSNYCVWYIQMLSGHLVIKLHQQCLSVVQVQVQNTQYVAWQL